jgi:hypothetical protein
MLPSLSVLQCSGFSISAQPCGMRHTIHARSMVAFQVMGVTPSELTTVVACNVIGQTLDLPMKLPLLTLYSRSNFCWPAQMTWMKGCPKRDVRLVFVNIPMRRVVKRTEEMSWTALCMCSRRLGQ